MVDEDVNQVRDLRGREAARQQLINRLFANQAEDPDGVAQYVRDNCGILFDVEMPKLDKRDRHRKSKRKEYLLGRKVLQGALDANFEVLIALGPTDLNCDDPQNLRWAIYETRDILNRPDSTDPAPLNRPRAGNNDNGYLNFYQATITHGSSRARKVVGPGYARQVGVWYFCSPTNNAGQAAMLLANDNHPIDDFNIFDIDI